MKERQNYMQKCKENTNILFIGKISKDGKKKFMNQNLGTDGSPIRCILWDKYRICGKWHAQGQGECEQYPGQPDKAIPAQCLMP